jgi:hypothetical protein
MRQAKQAKVAILGVKRPEKLKKHSDMSGVPHDRALVL